MTHEERKAVVAEYLLSKGVLAPADVEAEAGKLAAACSQAVITEKGLTDMWDKAYEAVMALRGVATDSTAVTETTSAVSMPTNTITAQEQRNIIEGLAKQKGALVHNSTDTIIEELVVDKPAPDQLIVAGTQGTINKEGWDKLAAKWADKVLPDDEDCKSKTNFDLLAKAAEAGTLVDVLIGAPSKRPVACVIQTASEAGADKKSVAMNVEKMEDFVALETDGYILATEKTAGAKLRYIKSTKDKKNPALVKPARTALMFTNKANATYAASRSILNETKDDSVVKSALCFKVDTGRKKRDGVTPIYTTVRASVRAAVKLTQRKPEYVDALGQVGGTKGVSDLMEAPDHKAMEAINKAQVAKIAELRSKVQAGDFTTIQNYGAALKSFENTAPVANASVGM